MKVNKYRYLLTKILIRGNILLQGDYRHYKRDKLLASSTTKKKPRVLVMRGFFFIIKSGEKI